MTKQTRVIFLHGAPSSGKTTIMAGLFYKMKKNRHDVEMVIESAKSFVWEGRMEALKCQPFVSSDQLWNIEKLIGKVDYIITDSPFMLAAIYGPIYTGDKYPQSFYDSMIEYHKKIMGYDFVLERGFPYEQNGRVQDEEEASDIHSRILHILHTNGIQYMVMTNTDSDQVIDWIYEDIFHDGEI